MIYLKEFFSFDDAYHSIVKNIYSDIKDILMDLNEEGYWIEAIHKIKDGLLVIAFEFSLEEKVYLKKEFKIENIYEYIKNITSYMNMNGFSLEHFYTTNSHNMTNDNLNGHSFDGISKILNKDVQEISIFYKSFI